jgi:protoporphyrinogen oxidase
MYRNFLANIDLKKPVSIYGAGVSGLLAGHTLKKLGVPYIIYECAHRTGGKIQTNYTEWGPVESAANAIVSSPAVEKLLSELKLPSIQAVAPLKKLIYIDQAVKSFPLSVPQIFRLLFGLTKKISPQDYQASLSQFLKPLFGNDSKNISTTLFRGIYATSSDQLYTPSLFPRPDLSTRYITYLKSLKRRQKIQSLSFKKGMQELIDSLEFIHKDQMRQFDPNHPIDDNSIVCTRADQACELVKIKFPHLAKHLSRVQYNALNTATLFLSSPIPKLEKAFGCLIAPSEDLLSYGVLANHEIFQDRVYKKDVYSYTLIGLIENEKQASEELSKIFSVKINQNDIHHFEVSSWEKALPVYDSHRFEAMNQLFDSIKDQSSNPGINFWGNYTDKISLRDLINQADETFTQIQADS